MLPWFVGKDACSGLKRYDTYQKIEFFPEIEILLLLIQDFKCFQNKLTVVYDKDYPTDELYTGQIQGSLAKQQVQVGSDGERLIWKRQCILKLYIKSKHK